MRARRDRAARAAELIATGIERWSAGDALGASTLWREAAAVSPGDVRAHAYADWASWSITEGAEAHRPVAERAEPEPSPVAAVPSVATAKIVRKRRLVSGEGDEETTDVRGELLALEADESIAGAAGALLDAIDTDVPDDDVDDDSGLRIPFRVGPMEEEVTVVRRRTPPDGMTALPPADPVPEALLDEEATLELRSTTVPAEPPAADEPDAVDENRATRRMPQLRLPPDVEP